jgi:hypothetical protein
MDRSLPSPGRVWSGSCKCRHSESPTGPTTPRQRGWRAAQGKNVPCLLTRDPDRGKSGILSLSFSRPMGSAGCTRQRTTATEIDKRTVAAVSFLPHGPKWAQNAGMDRQGPSRWCPPVCATVLCFGGLRGDVPAHARGSSYCSTMRHDGTMARRLWAHTCGTRRAIWQMPVGYGLDARKPVRIIGISVRIMGRKVPINRNNGTDNRHTALGAYRLAMDSRRRRSSI